MKAFFAVALATSIFVTTQTTIATDAPARPAGTTNSDAPIFEVRYRAEEKRIPKGTNIVTAYPYLFSIEIVQIVLLGHSAQTNCLWKGELVREPHQTELETCINHCPSSDFVVAGFASNGRTSFVNVQRIASSTTNAGPDAVARENWFLPRIPDEIYREIRRTVGTRIESITEDQMRVSFQTEVGAVGGTQRLLIYSFKEMCWTLVPPEKSKAKDIKR